CSIPAMASTYHELVEELRPSVRETTVVELASRLGTATLVDIRESEEHALGAIPGSVFLPRGVLEAGIVEYATGPDTDIVLYCATGHRSVLAAHSLQQLGYTNVSSLAGGIEEWKAQVAIGSVATVGAREAVERPETLTIEQRSRYSRHLTLPEVGERGQRKLLASKVLLIGAGGLGSPAALYLAAAGVGTLGIVDSDVVDASNLQRQILHDTGRIGEKKVDSARQTLEAINPDVAIETFATRLSAENVLSIMEGYDVVVDGADNFPTRYLVNDASLHLRIPVVHGSIFRFEGQATVFDPYEGPCYRCLFAEPPPPELAPSCAEAGVLGVLPGIIGSIEAVEALKLILGIGHSLVGRLLLYDALDQDFRILKLNRNPHCPACSDPAHPPRIVEYDQYCLPG
ncbi:MAG TPA: molybdopterin-synthase adenylyltransferase MoeB, partial [Acidimicrobiia bacterium]|nr:molybdopterin-synthase adenylyltransferase MoeB [Acidimicrobiia bacterium]